MVELATQHVQYPDTPEPERRDWARLTVVALDTALADGGIDAPEVATRKAYLAAMLSQYGDPVDFSPGLAPDEVARGCLALAGLTPTEAAAMPWEYREEDVPTMLRLRKIRNLITPAVALIGHVTDEETLRCLTQWPDVLPKLP
jgi:hypothetical protein